MTEEEVRQEMERRWRESMALLGLDDAPPPAAPPAARAKETRPEPQPVHVPAPPPMREPEPEPEYEDEPAPVAEMPVVDEETLETFDEPDREPAARVHGEAETAEGEGPPRDEKPNRRRRGRRGRRGKKPDDQTAETATSDRAVASEREPAAEGAAPESRAADDVPPPRGRRSRDDEVEGGPPRRGRGRGRGKPAPVPVPPVEEHDEEQDLDVADDEPVLEDVDLGEDDPQNPTEWDVPSWQELIASLYRPER